MSAATVESGTPPREAGHAPASRSALYVRVSTSAQLEGTSLGTQEADLRKYGEAMGYDPGPTFIEEEGISGRTSERPALTQMKEAAQRGEFDVLLVWDVTRFGRDARHSLNLVHDLHDNDVRVEDRQGRTSNDKLMFTILSAIAEYEGEQIKDRTMRARVERAKEGKWTGGAAPFGTRIASDNESGGCVLEEHPHTSPAIRDAFRWIVNEGATTGDVARRWNAEGLTTPRGKRWEHRNVQRILGHPRLAGRYEWGGFAVEHPAILTEQEFDQLKAALGRSRMGRRRGRRPYPLSGRIVCPCGGRWIGAGVHGSRNSYSRYYRCNRHHPSQGDDDCNFKAVRYLNADRVESAVWSAMTELKRSTSRLWDAMHAYLIQQMKPTEDAEHRVWSLRRRIDDREEARVLMVTEYAEAGIDAEVLTKALAPIDDDLATARADLAQAEALEAHGQSATELLKRVSTALIDLAEQDDPETRSSVIEALDLHLHLDEAGLMTMTGFFGNFDFDSENDPQGPFYIETHPADQIGFRRPPRK